MEIREAQKKLSLKYRDLPGVTGFSSCDNVLIIYVIDNTLDIVASFEKIFEGYSVEVKVLGEVRPQ